jgi:hypothetical protein
MIKYILTHVDPRSVNPADWNENYFVASFFEELMKFIGCVPSDWTSWQFVNKLFGTHIPFVSDR